MTVFTFSEARQKFAAILERARREGAVRVKRRDGQVFIIQPDRSRHSPLDVPGIDMVVWGRAMLEHEPGFRPLAGVPERRDDRCEQPFGKTKRPSL